ncbi:MAG: alpha-ketoglutarate-dependent dioxygenase AlkB [Flavobacteriaceae bacterium]|nr:alpha-ketoglutarate-dependent dioxygenase AlkB [Flavobacteriaceae bacterium]
MALFPDLEFINLNLQDATIHYYPNFLNLEQADRYFHYYLNHTTWQHDKITVFGKTYDQPRLTAFYSEHNEPLKYSDITMHPHNFEKEFLELKKNIEINTQSRYNCCLINLYRDGSDSNGWHADNEKQLGKNPIIASLTLGAERFFHLKHKTKKQLKHKILLKHGSLLLMKDKTQHFWLHQIPKTKKQIGKRINLTFRHIK